MIRDDIKNKVVELLHREFDVAVVANEEDSFDTLGLDAVDITAFADDLVREFGFTTVPFSRIMKWDCVGDIVDFVEDTLKCASKTFIPAFEIES